MGFRSGATGKESTCQFRRHRRHGFYPWVGKISQRGNGNPLQYSCLGNPMGRGAGGLQPVGSQRVRQDFVTKNACIYVITLCAT